MSSLLVIQPLDSSYGLESRILLCDIKIVQWTHKNISIIIVRFVELFKYIYFSFENEWLLYNAKIY